jgi:hypothetical protein
MTSIKSKRRRQFSLKSLLLVVTLVCASLAIGVVWPRLLVFYVAAFPAFVVFALSALDRMLQGDQPPLPTPIGSFLLIAVSTWAIIFLLFTSAIRIPGGFGPIQYSAGNALGTFVFALRTLTILAMIAGPILSAIIGCFRLLAGKNFRLGWLAVGIAFLVVAWVLLFLNPDFIPTA